MCYFHIRYENDHYVVHQTFFEVHVKGHFYKIKCYTYWKGYHRSGNCQGKIKFFKVRENLGNLGKIGIYTADFTQLLAGRNISDRFDLGDVFSWKWRLEAATDIASFAHNEFRPERDWFCPEVKRLESNSKIVNLNVCNRMKVLKKEVT